MPAQILGNPGYVIGLNQAIQGSAPSNNVYKAQLDQANASNARTFAINYVNTVADTNAVLAGKVLGNLGIANATLQTALEQAFTAFQTARGAVVYRLLELLQGLEGDATFGAAAAAYNNAVTNNFAYSSDPTNTVLRPTDLKTVSLTANTDILTGNIFDAGQVFTPGGNDRINSLQDEDRLTGTGTNPTLNLTFGNPNDNGQASITPSMTGVQTLNVAFTANNGAVRLDMQDATGLTNAVNISRISDVSNNVQVDNLLAPVANLSLTNSNSGTATVGINFAAGALAGAADATTLTLNRVAVVGLSVEDTDNVVGAFVGAGNLANGYETINLVSATAPNVVGVLSAEDLQTLNISGAQNLRLGGTGNTNGAQGVEATLYAAGLANVGGSLTRVDASTFTGNLNYHIGNEIVSALDNTSGLPVNLTVQGGAGNDTFRLTLAPGGVVPANYGVQATDSIDGGAGNNTLSIHAAATIAGTVSNVQNLEIRSGHDATAGAGSDDLISVDAARITALTNTFIRNEGQTVVGLVGTSAAENLAARVVNLTAAQAINVTTAHGTTGNNNLVVAGQTANAGAGFGGTRINLDVGAGVTTAAVTIVDGINNNPRYNFSIAADSDTEAGAIAVNGLQANNRNGVNTVANLTITDNDTESNTIEVVEYGRLTGDANGASVGHTGTITIAGTSTGFLNLDATRNAYRYDLTGGATDGGTAGTPANTNGLPTFGHRSGTAAQVAERLVATTIDSTAYAGSVIVRVSDSDTALGGQAIRFGAGNDTVIFDQVNVGAVNQRTAGLTISDTVSGGAGTDILALDGNAVKITIGASEWTNVSGFEIIRLIGNGAVGLEDNSFAGINLGGNAYNLTLTNELLANNGVQDGGVKRITIVNDNDASNDVVNTANDANAVAATFGATGVERGVNIDARALTANNSFAYYGEEGTSNTDDRFILSDANINGAAIIDGGAVSNNDAVTAGIDADSVRNADVADIRNSSVVTLGDLANLRNIGRFEFRNDSATTQNSILELNDDAVDRLVDAYQASRIAGVGISQNQETLLVKAINNPAVLGAVSNLNLQGGTMTGRSAVDVFLDRSNNHNITTGGGNDQVVLLGNFAAGVYGLDNTVTFENINNYANGVAGQLVYGATTVINLGGQTGTAAAGNNTADNIITYGAINLAAANITGVEGLIANSDVTLSAAQAAAFTSGTGATGINFTSNGVNNLLHSLVIQAGAGTVDLSKITVNGGGQLFVIANGVTTTGMAGAGVVVSTIAATDGNDVITGTAAADTIAGLAGNDTITGLGGTDTLYGNDGNDSIDGGGAADTIFGGAGNDTIIGGAAADTINLGAGNDVLVFTVATGNDLIQDYVVADDSIQLSKAAFAGLGPVGALTAAEFESGAALTAAATAAGRIVYNTTTGALYYDADGTGGAAAVQIATFTGVPALVVGEFSIIA